MNETDLDHIWKTLSDPTRRGILEFLREGSKTTTEIVDHFPDLTRFNVMKHLDVLRNVELVLTKEDGRKRINSLNSEPLGRVQSEWFQGFSNESNKKSVDRKNLNEERPRRISKLKEKKDFGWKRYD